MQQSRHKNDNIIGHALVAVILITALSTIASAAPPLPAQVAFRFIGSQTVDQNNTFTIEQSNGSVLFLTQVNDSRVGFVSPILINPRFGSNDGPSDGDNINVTLNGFFVRNFSFKAGIEFLNIFTPTTPLCGDRVCSTGESCVLCKNDCACDSVNVLSVPRNERFIKFGANNTLTVLLNTTREPTFFDVQSNGIVIARVLRDPRNETLDLSSPNAAIRGVRDGRNFVLVNIEAPKTLILLKSLNRSKICIKDSPVQNITEISGSCTGTNERIITCDGRVESGINCTNFDSFYTISGLAHSAATEFEPSTSSTAPLGGSGGSGGGRRRFDDEESAFINRSRGFVNLTGRAGSTVKLGCTSSFSCTSFTPTPCPPEGFQTRICSDVNECNIVTGKPTERRVCKQPIVVKVNTPKTEPVPVEKQPVASPTPVKEIRDQAPLPIEISIIESPVDERSQIIHEIPEPTPILEEPRSLDTTQNLVYLLTVIGAAILFIIISSLFFYSKHKTHERFVDDAVSFIKHNRDIGYGDSEIRGMLKSSDWPENYIKDAFKKFK